MDMGELSEEALRAEFRRSGEWGGQKSSMAKFCPVPDRDAGFAQYAGVVCRTHPGKAVALWGHLALLMSCPTRSTVGWWRNYNLSLRHGYSSAEEADFALNQCLYTQAMVESSAEALQSPAPPVVLPAAHGTVVSTPGDSVLLWWRHHLEILPARACFSCLLYTVLWGCATPRELDCLSCANTVVV